MSGFVRLTSDELDPSQSSFDPEEDASAPLLMGDPTIRQVRLIQRYITGRISVLGGDSLSSLADIGVSTDSKTALNFNSAELSKR